MSSLTCSVTSRAPTPHPWATVGPTTMTMTRMWKSRRTIPSTRQKCVDSGRKEDVRKARHAVTSMNETAHCTVWAVFTLTLCTCLYSWGVTFARKGRESLPSLHRKSFRFEIMIYITCSINIRRSLSMYENSTVSLAFCAKCDTLGSISP